MDLKRKLRFIFTSQLILAGFLLILSVYNFNQNNNSVNNIFTAKDNLPNNTKTLSNLPVSDTKLANNPATKTQLLPIKNDSDSSQIISNSNNSTNNTTPTSQINTEPNSILNNAQADDLNNTNNDNNSINIPSIDKTIYKNDPIKYYPSLTGWVNIMTENFENIFPSGSWSVSGSPTWEDRLYRPHNGSWSAWCAGTSTTDYDRHKYPNNMNARMKYGPFDLSDATQAKVEFYAWYKTEPSHDKLKWEYSTNGIDFTTSAYGTDSSNGWQFKTLDLATVVGRSQVWIAFTFTSDYSNYDEGAYIDDIVLKKYISPTPPSPSISSNTASFDLEKNQTKTINFTMSNNGGDALPFYLDVSFSSGLDITNTSTDLGTWARKNPGSLIWQKTDTTQPTLISSYLLYCLDGTGITFPAASTKYASLTIKATQTGSQWFKYRFSLNPSGTTPSNNPDTYYRKPTSGVTDQQGWYTINVNGSVNPPKGSISATINNISGGNLNIPGNSGIVKLYGVNNNYINQTTTNNKIANFNNNVPEGNNYKIKVYYPGPRGEEYWGEKTGINISSGSTTTVDFIRYNPTAVSVEFKDDSTGNLISTTNPIHQGRKVRAEFKTKNNFSSTILSVKNRLLVKKSNEVIDVDNSSNNFDIWSWPFDTYTTTHTFIPSATDTYFYTLEVKQNDIITDGWPWSSSGAFKVTNNYPNVPSNPNPSNDQTNQSIRPTLSWQGGDPDGDPVTYTVYFDTNSNPTTPVTGCIGITTTSCSINSDLNYSTLYYWKVQATDNFGLINTNSAWNFTTQAQPKGDLEVIFKNVGNPPQTIPGSDGILELYKSDGTYVKTKYTDNNNGDGKATFDDIEQGNYIVSGYYSNGARGQEYWGKENKYVEGNASSNKINYLTFTRNSPYASDLQFYRGDTSQKIDINSVFYLGEKIRAEMFVTNNIGSNQSVKANLIYDQNKDNAYDYDSTEQEEVVNGTTKKFTFYFTPNCTGKFYRTLKIKLSDNTLTDGWNWREVVNVLSNLGELKVKVNNVEGGLAGIPAKDGKVELFRVNNSGADVTQGQKNTDENGDGTTTYPNLEPGDYYLKTWYSQGPWGWEYWGESSKMRVSSGSSNTLNFTRNQPTAVDITYEDAASGAAVDMDHPLILGKSVKAKVQVKNHQNKEIPQVKVVFRLHPPSGSYEEKTSIISALPASTTKTYETIFTPIAIGTYQKEFGVYNVDCDWGSTDTWAKGDAFKVVKNQNHPPTLSNDYVTPTKGSHRDTFTYYVTYTDLDNDAPASAYAMIDQSSSNHPMIKVDNSDNNYTKGVIYKYETNQLSPGSHMYYFYFSDGQEFTDTIIKDNEPLVINNTPTLTVQSYGFPKKVGDSLDIYSRVIDIDNDPFTVCYYVNDILYSTSNDSDSHINLIFNQAGFNTIKVRAIDSYGLEKNHLLTWFITSAIEENYFTVNPNNKIVFYKGNPYTNSSFTNYIQQMIPSSYIGVNLDYKRTMTNEELFKIEPVTEQQVGSWSKTTSNILVGIVDRCDEDSNDTCYAVNIGASAIPVIEELQEGASIVVNFLFFTYEGSTYIFTGDERQLERAKGSLFNVGINSVSIFIPLVIDPQALNAGSKAVLHYAAKNADETTIISDVKKASNAKDLKGIDHLVTKMIKNSDALAMMKRLENFPIYKKIINDPGNLKYIDDIANDPNLGKKGLDVFEETIKEWNSAIALLEHGDELIKLEANFAEVAFKSQDKTLLKKAVDYQDIIDTSTDQKVIGRAIGSKAEAQKRFIISSNGFERLPIGEGKFVSPLPNGGVDFLNSASHIDIGDLDIVVKNPKTGTVHILEVKAWDRIGDPEIQLSPLESIRKAKSQIDRKIPYTNAIAEKLGVEPSKIKWGYWSDSEIKVIKSINKIVSKSPPIMKDIDDSSIDSTELDWFTANSISVLGKTITGIPLSKPVINTHNGIDILTNNSQITLEGTVDTNSDIVEVSLSQDSFRELDNYTASQSNWSTNIELSEGWNSFSIRSKKLYGGISEVSSINIFLDTQNPTISASPNSGTYNEPQEITILSDDSTAKIYYTVDGSDPSTNSFQYFSPITISQTTTFKLFAIDPAGNRSVVKTLDYQINIQAPSVAADPPGGLYEGYSKQVKLFSDNSQAIIYYTLDGSKPTTNSSIYKSPISKIYNGTVLKYFALDSAGNSSATKTELYQLIEPPQVGLIELKANSSRFWDSRLIDKIKVNVPEFWSSEWKLVIEKENYGIVDFSQTYVPASGQIPAHLTTDVSLLNGENIYKLYFQGPNGFKTSKTTTSFTVEDKITVKANPAGGTYQGMQYVQLSASGIVKVDYQPPFYCPDDPNIACIHVLPDQINQSLNYSVPNKDIYYTLEGSDPTLTSTSYSNPIVIKSDTVLKVIAQGATNISSNVQIEKYQIIPVDTTPPTKPWLNPTAPVVNQQKVNFSGWKDPGSSIWVNGREIVPIDNSVDWGYNGYPLNEGRNLLYFTSKDAAGNESAAYLVDITLDTQVPTTWADPKGGTFAANVKITLSANEPDSKIYWRFFGGNILSINPPAWQEYQNPLLIGDDAEEKQGGQLEFYAIDKAGNQSKIQEENYLIDKDPPIIVAPIPVGTVNSSQKVELKANEDAIIYYTLDGSTPTISSAIYQKPLQILKTTTLKLLAIDLAGNQSEVKTLQFSINTHRVNLSAKWQMLAVNSEIFDLEEAFGQADIWRYNHTSGQYEKVTDKLVPDEGYWIKTTKNQEIDLPVGDLDQTQSVSFNQGFGLVSGYFLKYANQLKFNDGVSAKTLTQAIEAGWLKYLAYYYDNSQYNSLDLRSLSEDQVLGRSFWLRFYKPLTISFDGSWRESVQGLNPEILPLPDFPSSLDLIKITTPQGSTATLYPANNLADPRRPAIIIEGIDQLNEYDTQTLYNSFNQASTEGLLDSLRSKNQIDFWLINWYDGGETVEILAEEAKYLLNKIDEFSGSNHNSTVLGFSAGGLIARYALADAYQQNPNDNLGVKKFMTYNTPHRGAWINLAMRDFFRYNNWINWNNEAKQFREKINKPLSQELLIGDFETFRNHYSTFYHIICNNPQNPLFQTICIKPIPELVEEALQNGNHYYYGDFYQRLHSKGENGYNPNVEKVAFTNGSYSNISDGTDKIILKDHQQLFELYGNAGLFNIPIFTFVLHTIYSSFYLDHYPGDQIFPNDPSVPYAPAFNFAIAFGSSARFFLNPTFIPTHSALDFDGELISIDDGYQYKNNDQSPFNRVYLTGGTYAHNDFSPHGEALASELIEAFQPGTVLTQIIPEKTTLEQGEPFSVALSLYNPSDIPQTIEFSNGCQINIQVDNQFDPQRLCTSSLTYRTIPPKQKYSWNWFYQGDWVQLQPGQHQLKGYFFSRYENFGNPETTITITPRRPDLSLENLTFNATYPIQGITQQIAVDVKNHRAKASNIKVDFYNGDPQNGGQYLDSWQMLAMNPGISQTATITWTPTKTGTQQIFAVVDPDNTTNELNENNNQTNLELLVYSQKLYVDQTRGNDSYDGLTSTIINGHGPKKTIRATVNSGSPYNIIFINPGVYEDDYYSSITLKEGMRLIADNPRQTVFKNAWALGLAKNTQLSGLTFNTASNTLFYQGDGTGFVIVENSIIKGGNQSSGIRLENIEQALIKNNLIINNYYSGLHLDQVKNLTVINNTFNNNGRDWMGHAIYDLTNNALNTRLITNNIFADSGGYGIYQSPLANNTIKNNLFWHNNTDNSNDLNLSDDNLFADPLFSDPAQELYYLNSNSLAINGGSIAAENLGLSTFTTQQDQTRDSELVDLGFHYPVSITNTDQTPADQIPPQVNISPKPGTYFSTQTITLSSNEPANIYYTTDDSQLSLNSSKYTSPFTINQTTTLKYFAIDSSGNPSAWQSAQYIIKNYTFSWQFYEYKKETTLNPGNSEVYSLELINNGEEQDSYSFRTIVPAGWDNPRFSDQETESLSPQGRFIVGSLIKVPQSIQPGNYTIKWYAKSKTTGLEKEINKTITVEDPLSLENYQFEWTNYCAPSQVESGRNYFVCFKLVNTGTTTDSYELGNQVPEGWNSASWVSTTDTLQPGQWRGYGTGLTIPPTAKPGVYSLTWYVKSKNSDQIKTINLDIKVITDSFVSSAIIQINNQASHTNTHQVELKINNNLDLKNLDKFSDQFSLMRLSNDKINWSEWETYQTTKDWLLTEQDGLKTVYGQFKNGLDQQSDIYSAAIMLDTLSAEVNHSLEEGNYDTVQHLILTSVEPAVIYYTLDGSDPTKDSPNYKYPIRIDKNTTVKYLASDQAGNKSVIYQKRYSVELPLVELIVLTKDQWKMIAVSSDITNLDSAFGNNYQIYQFNHEIAQYEKVIDKLKSGQAYWVKTQEDQEIHLPIDNFNPVNFPPTSYNEGYAMISGELLKYQNQLKFSDGTTTKNLAEAISSGWIKYMAYYYDNDTYNGLNLLTMTQNDVLSRSFWLRFYKPLTISFDGSWKSPPQQLTNEIPAIK